MLMLMYYRYYGPHYTVHVVGSTYSRRGGKRARSRSRQPVGKPDKHTGRAGPPNRILQPVPVQN